MCTHSKWQEKLAISLFAASSLLLPTVLVVLLVVPIVSEADPIHPDPVLERALVLLPGMDGVLEALPILKREALLRRIEVIVTGYSSTPDQTDSTPFVTAANTRVREEVVAANDFPFGTRVRFPELFGDKVFVVEDRLHPRNSHKIDVWFPTRASARIFGIQETVMEILPEES